MRFVAELRTRLENLSRFAGDMECLEEQMGKNGSLVEVVLLSNFGD